MARNRLKSHDQSSRPCLPPCRVCGDQAAGYHYGVNTCEACKGFFHRSIRRYKEYTCRANRPVGYCEYKPGKRKSCQFCRYQRCLLAGMSREAIKTGRYTYTKRMNDTREIKRLQRIQHQFCLDFLEPDSPASFKSTTSTEYNITEYNIKSTTPTEYNITEWPGHELCDQNFVEVDATTREEFERLLRSQHNNSSLVYLPDSSSFCSSKSVQYEKHITPRSYMFSNSLYCNNKTTGRHFLPLSMEDAKTSPLDGEIDISEPLSLSGAYVTANSRFVKQNSDNLKFSDNRLSSENKNCNITYENCMNVNYDRKQQNSVIESPGKIDKIRNVPAGTWRQARNIRDHTERHQQVYLTTVLPEADDNTSCSASSSTNYTCPTDVTYSAKEDSIFLELSPRVCEGEKLIDSDFDLFPDISLNLDGQPSSSPTYFQNDNLDAQILSPVGQSSSPRIFCPTATNQSSELSPGGASFSQDNENRQQCGHNLIMFQATKFSKSNTTYVSKDTGAPRGIDLYKGCLDLSVDSGVKDVQQVNVTELYKDKKAVIAALMASYKVSVGDYSHMPKEEMFAQQKAHFEACQLKKQTFGDLGFLPEHEYDEIYSVTGIDVDNRRTVIRKFLNKVEKDVRDLVQFAKSIPGFSYLDINLQMELVKLARAECFMLSHYRTVNAELGIMVGLTGEHWACYYELGTDEVQSIIAEYVLFSDKLQKMAPTQEEEVLLKAIIVVSTDGDKSVNSPLAEAIRWQLVMCLLHSLERNREQPSLFLARYILALTQSRTLAESTKDFLRKMKLRKYSSIEQNPLLWEIFSWIVLEKRDDDSCQENNMVH